MKRESDRFVRALRAPLRLLLALVILFEEWGWEPLQRAMAWLARLPVLRQLEAPVSRLPPYAALVVLFLPGVALLPVKVGALWLIAHGHGLAGLVVIVVTKLVGTAILARLFTLTRPALIRLAWFATLYGRWTAWKQALLAWVRASRVWRAAHELRMQLRGVLAGWRKRWFG